MSPKERLEAALKRPDPDWALRRAIEELAAEGLGRDGVIQLLEELLVAVRAQTPLREGQEDAILDAMDGIYGWCHPSAQIQFRSAEPDPSRKASD
jgi:hypothetical protein